jgi:hypothetical protein
VVVGRHTEVLVQLLADGPDGSVSDHCERGSDFHAWSEAIGRCANLVYPLIEQADAKDF